MNPTIPARVTRAPRSAASPYTAETEETVTIRPERRSIMAGRTARHSWNTPSRLVSITARQSASASRASGWSRVIPAQLTSASTGPRSCSVRWTQDGDLGGTGQVRLDGEHPDAQFRGGLFHLGGG